MMVKWHSAGFRPFLAEKKARLEAVPALLQQLPKAPATPGAASRLLTVNPLLVVSLVLALASVLFQVPHRCVRWTRTVDPPHRAASKERDDMPGSSARFGG